MWYVNESALRAIRQFAAELADLRVAVGSPSFRTIAKLSNHKLPHSTAADALKGDRLPSLQVVLMFLNACQEFSRCNRLEIDDEDFDRNRWHDRWIEIKKLTLGRRQRADVRKTYPADELSRVLLEDGEFNGVRQQGPDLLKMDPTQFEHFVRQLLEARGLEGWTTKRTGEDGFDAVVINRDPFIGGLTIVEAKKYSSVVGVSHIRELIGAMEEKRAGRGVLVTTSWFASGCWTKATENGRVELIDGPRLRYLAQEHLHMDVLVAPPAPRARSWHP
jgi:hypothetical protein